MNLQHEMRDMGHIDAMPLGPLQGASANDRYQAYVAARNSFAKALGLSEATADDMPVVLDLRNPVFDLTLTIHMAALVTVDAHMNELCPPSDPAALSAYLLYRERAYWARLHEAGRISIDADAMAQVVYVATLTGPMSYTHAQSALECVGIDSGRPLGSILKDHAVGYPGDRYVQPLYPDRLGEDFLALTTPGHRQTYQPDPWAETAVPRLLALGDDSAAQVWTRHALTVLIEAARRWPHVADGRLYPLLRLYPRLALEAGGAALAALAHLDNPDFEALNAIAACLPGRHSDLDVGMAALTQRLGDHLLATEQDPAERAKIYFGISRRVQNAGLHAQGLAPAEQAVLLYRELARREPARYQEELAWALNALGIHQHLTGHKRDALAATQEAADIIEKLVNGGRIDLEAALGACISPIDKMLSMRGRPQRA